LPRRAGGLDDEPEEQNYDSADSGRKQRAPGTDDRDLQQFGECAADKRSGNADEKVSEIQPAMAPMINIASSPTAGYANMV
jgi:hypothetical protein